MSPFSWHWLLFMGKYFLKSELFGFESPNVVYFPFISAIPLLTILKLNKNNFDLRRSGNRTSWLYHQPVECAEGHGGVRRPVDVFGVSAFSQEDPGRTTSRERPLRGGPEIRRLVAVNELPKQMPIKPNSVWLSLSLSTSTTSPLEAAAHGAIHGPCG